MTHRLLAVFAGLLLSACVGDFEPLGPSEGGGGGGGGGQADASGGGGGPITFSADVQPAIMNTCSRAGCHSGAAPAANYSTVTYADTLGNGLDGIANVIPGDATSQTYIYANLNPPHNGTTPAVAQLLSDWIVANNAAQ